MTQQGSTTIPKRSQNQPKTTPKRTQNDSKTKRTQNDTKTILKRTQKDPKTIPKRPQNDSKTTPKRSQNYPKTGAPVPFFDKGFDWCVVSPAAVLHIGVLTASGASPPFFTRGGSLVCLAMHRRLFLLVMGVRRRCGDDLTISRLFTCFFVHDYYLLCTIMIHC